MHFDILKDLTPAPSPLHPKILLHQFIKLFDFELANLADTIVKITYYSRYQYILNMITVFSLYERSS